MATSTSKDAKQAPKAKSKPEPEQDSESSAPPPKKKGNLLKILLLIGLPLLLAGGGAAWYFLGNKQDPDEKAQAGKSGPTKAAKAGKPGKPPVFLPSQKIDVNLQPEDGVKVILSVVMTIQVTDTIAGETIKQYMPIILDRVSALLADKKESQISTGATRTAIKAEILEVIRGVVGTSVPAENIVEVQLYPYIFQ